VLRRAFKKGSSRVLCSYNEVLVLLIIMQVYFLQCRGRVADHLAGELLLHVSFLTLDAAEDGIIDG
jgi:hypothetical protein